MNHRVLVLVGRGRYADPWHDHAATSYEVARLIDDLGPGAGEVDVMVRSSFPEALDDLADVDLLVVNTGSGRRDPEFDGDDARWLPVHQRLEDYARAGGGVLGLHQAAMTFEDSPFWERILGGRWVHGVSGHPPLGDAVVQVRTDADAIAQGLHEVTAVDERRCAGSSACRRGCRTLSGSGEPARRPMTRRRRPTPRRAPRQRGTD